MLVSIYWFHNIKLQLSRSDLSFRAFIIEMVFM